MTAFSLILRRVLSMVFCVEVVVANAQPLVVGSLHLPPFYILDTNEVNVIGGIYIDRIRKVLDRAKIEYSLIGLSPRRLYSDFASGKVHVVIASTGNTLIDGTSFLSPLPLGENTIELCSLLPSREIPGNLADLAGKSVITIAGYSYAGLADDLKAIKVDVLVAPNHDSALQMLKAGRAPYALVYEGVVDESIKSAGLVGKVNSRTVKTLQVLVQISKKVPNADAIMARTSKVMADMHAAGELGSFRKK